MPYRTEPCRAESGTRQGCPLSPMLFALSLEPLAQKIRQDQISIKDTQHAISLYADDILLYFSDFGKIPNILETFNCFGKFSGYRINWSKSSLLPLNKKAQSIVITTTIPITNQITYLGIFIRPSLKEIVHINYDKVFQKLKRDIDRWRTLVASLESIVSTVKINILPRVNFLRVLSHLVHLPGPNQSSIVPPPPAGLRSYYFIWFRTAVRLRHQASSSLPRCLVMTAQEKAANA
uniref:Reverse transcriptase domain-containing protein n=1 Tax=Sinocyclocheilus grahami TaxID=75366 RepID=A0A672RLN0_SINGR